MLIISKKATTSPGLLILQKSH